MKTLIEEFQDSGIVSPGALPKVDAAQPQNGNVSQVPGQAQGAANPSASDADVAGNGQNADGAAGSSGEGGDWQALLKASVPMAAQLADQLSKAVETAPKDSREATMLANVAAMFTTGKGFLEGLVTQ